MTNSPSVEHTQDEQHTAEVSKVITMDTKVTFEVTNSNIWLNHLATTTIIQVLVAPGGTNQWLENNMPESFSDTKYKTWFKALKLDIKSRQTIERNIVAMDNWWQNQPEAAEATIHRVAVCLGIAPGKIKSGQNENLLKVMTVALTMAS